MVWKIMINENGKRLLFGTFSRINHNEMNGFVTAGDLSQLC